MLIFVDEITERLIYTLDFIFKDREIAYELTNDWIYFQSGTAKRLVYSAKYGEHELMVEPASLLFDEDIRTYPIDKKPFYKEDCLSFDGITDPFASIFYVLSRHEEYTCKLKDFHDRFPAKESVLYRFSWLNQAICDHWAEDIIAFLEEQFNFKVGSAKIPFRFQPTFDIDNTYAFKWKDGFRRWLSISRDFLKRDRFRREMRKKVESGELKDPYDTFDEIKKLDGLGLNVKIFWLIGDYSKYDKNISALDVRHQDLIKEMSHFAEIGLHPSYKSNSSQLILDNEKQQLEAILAHRVNFSRQHFLKMSLPQTYQLLIASGFTADHTMAYAEETGFRAGTARPFRFFDLSKNTLTDLVVHPFVYMDATLLEYKKLTPEEAQKLILELYLEVKAYGGNFTFLWHNESIGNFGKWENWKAVFDFTIKLHQDEV